MMENEDKYFEVGESIIPSLKHYTLSVEEQEDQDGVTGLCYTIINNHTQVVEGFFAVMPEAVGQAYSLEAWYDKWLQHVEGTSELLVPEKKLILPNSVH